MSLPTDDPFASNGQYNLTEFSDFVNETIIDWTFTEELAYVLNVYFTPALVFLGTIGNLLSIIVFIHSKPQSTSQYLSALAISDTIFLLQLIPPWLKAVRVSRLFAHQGFCQCFVYLTYVSSSSSSWLVVSFTIERFVAVLYPLRRIRMCTVRRARLVILAIAVSCLAINTPVLKFAVPNKTSECNIDYELMDHAARFNVVDTIFSFTLPLTIITVLNIWIVVGVCRLSRVRGQLIKEEEMKSRALKPVRQVRGNLAGRRTRSSLQRSQQRITRMLLIVSSVFVLLNLPAYSMRIVAYANNMSSYEYSGRWAALQQICLLFFNSNFGINFFLYCMTGQNFRRALCQTFPWLALAWNALKRFFCCRKEETVPPPRPSVSNSLSVNTEASAYAATSRVSLNKSIKGVFAVSGSYLKLWRFDNSRQQKPQRMQYEMQVYPVRSFRFPTSQPERPVPLWPENSVRLNRPWPAFPRMIAPQTFRPIPCEFVPGQIPQLERSPSNHAAIIDSPQQAHQDGSPFSLDEFESFMPATYDTAADRYPLERLQPQRRFSLPARQCYTLERNNTPPEWKDVSPLPWPSPPASRVTSPACEFAPPDNNELSERSGSPSGSNRSAHGPAFHVYPVSPPACL